MDYKVILTYQAIEDLREIVSFIAQDNPLRAEQFGVELCEKTRPLAQQPFMGRVVPEFRLYGVHEQAKAVYVCHFWHGARGEPPAPPQKPFP